MRETFHKTLYDRNLSVFLATLKGIEPLSSERQSDVISHYTIEPYKATSKDLNLAPTAPQRHSPKRTYGCHHFLQEFFVIEHHTGFEPASFLLGRQMP